MYMYILSTYMYMLYLLTVAYLNNFAGNSPWRAKVDILCLSVSLYVCVSLCLSLSMSICLYVYLSLCLSLSISVFLYVCLFLHVHVSLYLSMSASLYVCLSLHVCLSLCLSLYLSVNHISIIDISGCTVFHRRIRASWSSCKDWILCSIRTTQGIIYMCII